MESDCLVWNQIVWSGISLFGLESDCLVWNQIAWSGIRLLGGESEYMARNQIVWSQITQFEITLYCIESGIESDLHVETHLKSL